MGNQDLKILKNNQGKIFPRLFKVKKGGLFSQLTKNPNKLYVLYNKKKERGEFVGSLRQIKRRLKKLFRAGPLPYLLFEAEQHGLQIAGAELLSDEAKRYNKFMDQLKEKLKNLPKEPGVYQFKNKDGEVIYVGKAKSLKNRVGQYFNKTDERPQIPYLLAEVADLDYTVVSNELESLFLENTLIKEYMPRYNIQLRDDKNYAFITIDYSCEIPAIGYARKFDRKSKNIHYFGPYSAAYKIRSTLNLIRRIFPYCSATKVSDRPCFYYYLHRCPGVCIGKISLDEYRQQLSRIEKFLAGDTAQIKKELAQEMKIAAAGERFEQAARIRDQLQALELLDERQMAILARPVNWDVVSAYSDGGFTCVNLFKIREGKMQDKENFIFEDDLSRRHSERSEESQTRHEILRSDALPQDDATKEILQTFLEQYYLETSSAPKEIFLQSPVDDAGTITKLLQTRFNKKISLSVPKRGKQLELVKLGEKNAEEYLKNWLQSQAVHLDRIQGALGQLKDILGLEKIPERIECFDISNIQGTNPVGSMVVFKNGVPAKSEYRKFKINSKSTPDDFAMMREMLDRRLCRLPGSPTPSGSEPWPVPDLMVIDGGKGQLGIAVEMLEKHKANIPVIGLAKRIEEIFLPDKPEPIILSHDNPALQMLQRLRDEAHRFGITFHRELRSKAAVKSALDSIPGIGPKFKKLLKEKFGTVAKIRKTPIDELAKVVGQKVAEKLKQNL